MLKRTRLKRKAKSELRKLKDTLWKLCRKIIIEKYGNTCYCCGAKNLEGANLHLGHFIPSSICSAEMRYDLDNLRPSCYRCNIHLSGNWVAYEKHLRQEKGQDFVEELKQRNEDTKGGQYDVLFYQEKIKN